MRGGYSDPGLTMLLLTREAGWIDFLRNEGVKRGLITARGSDALYMVGLLESEVMGVVVVVVVRAEWVELCGVNGVPGCEVCLTVIDSENNWIYARW